MGVIIFSTLVVVHRHGYFEIELGKLPSHLVVGYFSKILCQSQQVGPFLLQKLHHSPHPSLGKVGNNASSPTHVEFITRMLTPAPHPGGLMMHLSMFAKLIEMMRHLAWMNCTTQYRPPFRRGLVMFPA